MPAHHACGCLFFVLPLGDTNQEMILGLFQILYVVLITMFVGIVELVAVPFDGKGHVFYWLSKLHSWTILTFCRVRIVVQGLENIDINSTYIFASNHASLFDIPAVIAGFPGRVRMVYKRELEKIPLFGWGLKLSKVYIGIDRNRSHDASKSLDEAIQKIRSGASVLLFAEGTRTSDGKLQQFKRGAFNMATRAGVPVVPLTINGSYRILQKGKIRFNPGTITLIFDKPIPPPSEEGKEAELALRDQAREIIASHYIDQ